MTYNEIMQTAGKEITPKIYFYENNIRVDVDRDYFKRAKMYYNTGLVGTVMQCMELELIVQLPNTAIYFEIEAKFGEYTATKTYGAYYRSEEPTYNADTKTYTHNLYDNFVKTMVDYKSITISYPTTVLNFFKQLCNECGLSTNINSLPNGNQPLNRDIYSGINYTYRDVFQDIGQATGTLFKIDGREVKTCPLGNDSIVIDDDILKNQNISFGEHYGAINVIVLSRAGGSDNIYYPEILPENAIEFKIADNQLMNDNNRVDYLEALYNQLSGIQYDLFDTELVGYGGFEPLQKIEFQTNENDTIKTYNSYVFNNEQVITQGYSESIYTERPKESETDYKKADTTDRRINQTYLIVDKQNQTIESVVNQVDTQNTKISKITQDIDEIRGEISDVADVTTTGETQNAYLEFENINVSEPISINLRPISEDISNLLISSNMLISDNFYLKQRVLDFHNITTDEHFTWKLPTDLWFVGNTYDELHLNYDGLVCEVIRRIGVNADGSKYILDNERTETYDYPTIQLTDGDYKISLLGYSSAYIYMRLMSKNIYTSQFATKVEVNSAISQTAQQINLEVSKKAYTSDLNNAVSTLNSNINQTANSITSSVNAQFKNYSTTTQMNNKIEQEITASENKINIEVGKKVNNSDYNGANIMLLINDDGSSATINADKVNINGVITAINNNTSTTINGNKITTGSITANQVASDIITTKNFSAQNINADNIKSGTISASSINLGNGKFKVNTNGAITSTSGTIGGWSITSSKLRGLTGSDGIYGAIRPYGVQLENSSGDVLMSAGWGSVINASTSDKRLKNTINEIDDKFEQLFNDLKPVTFYYNKEFGDKKKHIGFIAQDVLESQEKINEDLAMVQEDELAKKYNLYKQEIIALNTWQIQKLKKQVQEQDVLIGELIKRIEKLESESDK